MPLFDALFGSPVRPRFGAILSAVLGRRISGTACRDSLFFTREPDSDPGPLVFYSPTSHSHLDLASVSPSPCA
jgi:hypothetical protein